MDEQQRTSPEKYSAPSDEEIEEARQNLERALRAYDEEGEAGLQREMQRIHPREGLRTVSRRGMQLTYREGTAPEPSIPYTPSNAAKVLREAARTGRAPASAPPTSPRKRSPGANAEKSRRNS